MDRHAWKWSAVVVLSLFVLGAMGCGDAVSPGEPSAQVPDGPMYTARHHIKGGSKDTSSTAVVGLLIRRGGGGAICTGTLVTPNLVLTARHCISNLSSSRIQCGSTTFTGTVGSNDVVVTTDGTDIQNSPSPVYGVSDLYVPSNAPEVCGNDIALVQLRSDVPSSEASPRAPRLSTATQRGETYTAIGYGQTGSGGGSGTRRRLEGIRVLCVGNRCSSSSVASKEFVGGGGVCQGDSGGGAYISSGKVIGIASRADGECKRSVYTRVYPWRQWLTKTAGKAISAGNYSPPSWTNISDDDDDTVINSDDNCPNKANADQSDIDGDGTGDVCDSDIDGDGVSNSNDNCPKDANADQSDLDRNGEGDACDADREDDGVDDTADLCPDLKNPDQQSSGSDGTCKDADGDLWADVADNCPQTANPDQNDSDGDGTGDACDGDSSTGGSSDGGSSDGGSTGSGSDDSDDSSSDPTPVPSRKDDGGDATRSGCSVVGTGGPGGLVGSVLFALASIGLFRVRRRS